MSIAEKMLKAHDGIRLVIAISRDGEMVEMHRRTGLKPYMGEDAIQNVFTAQMAIVWGVAEAVGKYVGPPTRICFHHKFVDVIAMKAKETYYVISVDKNVDSDELSRKLMELIS